MVVFDQMKPSSEKPMILGTGVKLITGLDVEYEDYVVKTRTGDIWIPYIL